jgi:nicotinate-nucleotide pyrophosphorylase (carboxylating)
VTAMQLAPLPDIMLEPLARMALLEDLGRAGDITTNAVVAPAERLRCAVTARRDGIVAGTDLVRIVYGLLDREVTCRILCPDGTRVRPGDVVIELEGPARAILSGERVALNFLGHLCGVATATASLVDAVQPFATRITCTRKTTPGLRALEKHAVRAGGGVNHRFGLDDAVLIKDNHIAAAGSIETAIARARENVGHLVKIEVEIDTLDQLRAALALRPDAVLLDNMPIETLREAVRLVDGAAVTEASGTITRETIRAIAETGVDLASAGWITHSAPQLDLGLDVG